MPQRTKVRIYKSPDGRKWWIDEQNPISDSLTAVCRTVEFTNGRNWFGHTAIWDRRQLTLIEEKQ